MGMDGRQQKVKLTLRQLQIEPAFPNTVPIDVLTKSGKRRILVKPTSKEAIETFDFEQAPSAVVVDPESGILKELVNHP